MIQYRDVQRRHPDEAAPLDLEPGAVYDNVDGTHVPYFPHEELDEADVLGDGTEEKAVVHDAVQGVRLEREGEAGEHPESHTEAAVDEPFDVHPENTRVQLGAPHEVDHPRTAAPTVFGGGELEPFNHQEHREEEAEDVERGERRREDVVHDPEVIPNGR